MEEKEEEEEEKNKKNLNEKKKNEKFANNFVVGFGGHRFDSMSSADLVDAVAHSKAVQLQHDHRILRHFASKMSQMSRKQRS